MNIYTMTNKILILILFYYIGLSDGFAEFFDNSIQAVRNEPVGDIRLSLYLGDNRTGYALIMDNGCGMSTKELQDFATHSLDHKARFTRDSKRGLDPKASSSSMPSNTENSFLSKFGVGAKQAGFYLGDRIRVITKQKESKINCEQGCSASQAVVGRQVKEFVLDSRELDEKFSESGNTEEAYNGVINHRHIGEVGNFSNQEEKDFPMCDEIESEITSYEMDHMDHFTIIVLHLRPEIRAQLRFDTTLAQQMAEIYYFHLHPEHTYESLKNMSKFGHSASPVPNAKRYVFFVVLLLKYSY